MNQVAQTDPKYLLALRLASCLRASESHLQLSGSPSFMGASPDDAFLLGKQEKPQSDLDALSNRTGGLNEAQLE